MTREEIAGAVARGWCHPETENRVMDAVLAGAITEEVATLVRGDRKAYLGCATTKELIDELAARADVSATIGEEWPGYRTVDS